MYVTFVNSNLNSNCRGKLYIADGIEFGSEKVSVIIIHIALYGLKSRSVTCCAKLSEILKAMGYKSIE